MAKATTTKSANEGPLPENAAINDPAPATEMDSPSGAFVESEIKAAIDVNHPSVDNNPRAGTTAIQNGQDWNDPSGRRPDDKDFVGQGIDRTPYGDGPAPKSKD